MVANVLFPQPDSPTIAMIEIAEENENSIFNIQKMIRISVNHYITPLNFF